MQLTRTSLLLLSLLCSFAVQASDWQYAGFAKIGQDDTFLFYDSEGVQRPGSKLARYWVKSMTRSNLDRYFQKHEKSLVEKTARKVAVGYVPRFYQLEAIRSQFPDAAALRDAIVEISSYEVVANEPGALLKHKLYFEIDCSERKSRVLEMISYDSKGDIARRGGSAQASYQFIPPDSNGEWQSQLICPNR